MAFIAFLRANIRWLLVGFLLMAFSGFGQTFFIALSVGNLQSEFGLSHGEFGSLYMAATLASALTLPWIGKSLDHFPLPVVVSVVLVLLAAFCLAMANVSSVWMLFVAIYGLRLFGQGMMSNASMTAVGRWFEAQRGRAISIAALGFPMAEASLPITFVTLAGLYGWRTGWWAAAGTLLLVVLPVILLLLGKDRTPQGSASTGSAAAVRHWTQGEVMRDPLFWLLIAGVLAPPFIVTAILFHQVYLVELRGWTMALFASAFMVMSLFAVMSSLTLGHIIDRFSARSLLPFMLLPIAVGCLVLSFVHQAAGAFLFMACLGVSNGFIGTMIGALWPEVYGTRYLGSVRSLVFALMVLSSAVGPGLVGWLIDFGVDLDIQFIGMSLYCLVMAAIMTGALGRLNARLSSMAAG